MRESIIRRLRKAKGVTQAQLAEAVHVEPTNVSKWENGNSEPSKSVLSRLASYFNVSTDYLLGHTDNPLPNIVDLGDETLCPLVGQVVAGMPIEAQENLEGYIYISYKPADEYFALRVHGESMVGAGIPDGAIVAVAPPKKRHRAALTREQQAALVEYVKGRSYDLITRFLLATGLRIGEALALTKADIRDGRVYVSKNLVRINKQDIVQDAPKTAAGNRAVPISRELEAELLAQPGNRLFTSRQDAVARNFRTVSAKLGFHVSAHILRHTYATRLEEAGVPAKVAQYLMGHATIQMTKDVYTDVQDSYIKTFDERVITFTDTRKRKD